MEEYIKLLELPEEFDLNDLKMAYRKKEIKVKEKIINWVKTPAKYISNTIINGDIEVLRKMFNLAIQNGWLTKNPCTGITKLKQETF